MSKVESKILEMRLLSSDVNTDGIYDDLNEIAKDSNRLYASVAFVTTSGPYSEILEVLKEGYLCTDISFPTNLDFLQRIHDEGVDVSLHLRQIKGKGIEGFNHLLHSKLLLFECEKYATIIIGSHNWTSTALGGVNTEDSLLIKVQHGDPMHTKTKDRLDWIKSNCLDFDPKKMTLYRSLQGERFNPNAGTKMNFSLLHDNIFLSAPQEIVMFGNNLSEYEKKIPTRKDECLVSVFDKSNPKKYQLYDGTIIRETLLPRSDKSLTPELFPERYHFIRRSGEYKHPLIDVGPIDKSFNYDYEYMVWIRLDRRKSSDSRLIEKVPTPKPWMTDHEIDKSNSPLFKDNANPKVKIEKENTNFLNEFEEAFENEKKEIDVDKIKTLKKYYSSD